MSRKPRNLTNQEISPVSAMPTPRGAGWASIQEESNRAPTPTPTTNPSEDDSAPLQAVKPKKSQTEAQKAATARMRAKLAEKYEKLRAEKAAAAEEYKKQVEEKVIKKAIAIKKKQIKQQMVLDEISSDDEPIEEIIPKMRKTIARQPSLAPPRKRRVFPHSGWAPTESDRAPQGTKVIFM
jgi:hypothetical protein